MKMLHDLRIYLKFPYRDIDNVVFLLKIHLYFLGILITHKFISRSTHTYPLI